MPQINETITSPNQFSRNGFKPQLIVCHICDGTYNGTKSWFQQSASQTSSHFVVGQDGKICSVVPIDKGAWCNGTIANTTVPLVKQLGSNPNYYTVSIEHEGYYAKTNGALTEKQLDATVWLIGYIQTYVLKNYGITIPTDRDHIIGHNEINAVTRPNCPGQSFPWSELMNRLNNSYTDTENTAYRVQTGYFENKHYAEAQLARVKAAGFDDAFIAVCEKVTTASGD